MIRKKKFFLGINLEMDPSAAIVSQGKVIAYCEEERFNRIKHAKGYYPQESIKYCLNKAGGEGGDIEEITINWNLRAYNSGEIEEFYKSIQNKYKVDNYTLAWQKRNLFKRSKKEYENYHKSHLRSIFGNTKIPNIMGYPHHFTHAFQSFSQSGFQEAICITIDGSGDQHTTVLWKCQSHKIAPVYEIRIPHSLGWFYAAITEYLGFKAYDGEYKVMGLAAYGGKNYKIRQALKKIIKVSKDGIGYVIDPSFIHYGKHSYSGRFTDKLVHLLGKKPLRENNEIDKWSMSLAFESQRLLEITVIRLIKWATEKYKIYNVCVGGGVGLNVKLNSKIFDIKEVKDVFAHPLCSDSGAACGSALLANYKKNDYFPEKLTNLNLGYCESDREIEKNLKITKVNYKREKNIALSVAKLLDKDYVVGWFQGSMEAGPRALGYRSILANPRSISSRDRVNKIVKFREDWRPFCPSVLEEHVDKYFSSYTHAPFMIMAFQANNKLSKDAPAIVHVDGTARVQMVSKKYNPLYHKMISAFYKITGVAVVLNTSFNIKGEPIVCTSRDALRTFWSSGLDALAIGNYLILKPKVIK